jgi:hypothetical protein
VSAEDDEAAKHQQNDTKCWKNLRIHPRRPSPNNPWARRHRWTSYGVHQEILTENLNMCHITVKFLIQLLTNDQTQWRIYMCLELREKANEHPTFISRIIKGDEKLDLRIWSRNKATIVAVEEPTSPEAKKAQKVRSSTKSMLIVFFNVKGIVHREFVPPNTTANYDFYCDVLGHERKCVTKKTGTLAQPQLTPSRQRTTRHNPKSLSTSHPHNIVFINPFQCYPPITLSDFQLTAFQEVSPTKFSAHFLSQNHFHNILILWQQNSNIHYH